jgi:hypothetical protein
MKSDRMAHAAGIDGHWSPPIVRSCDQANAQIVQAARFLNDAAGGILKINPSTSVAHVDVRFGRWKASSLGSPQHGAFDVEYYPWPQTIHQTLSRVG